MKVEIFHEPLTIVMVHDFFSCEERLFLIDFFKHNNKNFFRGSVVSSETQNKEVYHARKNNKNLWLYENKDSIRNCRNVINLIENKMWSNDLRNVYNEVKDNLFHFFQSVNSSSILVSKYTKGSFYDWHIDNALSITGNIWLCDSKVTGGDFEVKNQMGESRVFNYKDNTLLLFPSLAFHRVTKVEKGTRYSIQYFSKFIPKGFNEVPIEGTFTPKTIEQLKNSKIKVIRS